MKTFPILAAMMLLGSAAITAADPTPDEWKALWERDKKAVAAGICQVHNVKMTPTSVPIHYGLARQEKNEPTQYERISGFPHARKFQEGGCCPIPGETTANIPLCPACVSAEAKWVSSHQKP